jgi:hypothetical protein
MVTALCVSVLERLELTEGASEADPLAPSDDEGGPGAELGGGKGCANALRVDVATSSDAMMRGCGTFGRHAAGSDSLAMAEHDTDGLRGAAGVRRWSRGLSR